jgi:ABC-type branched-subunit amino acid transport system substrate-binding protein
MHICHKLATLALVLFSNLASADNGVTDREILIGQFAAISGPAAQLGQRMQLGMQAYFTAVNAQGGVHGRTIRLITRDDATNRKRPPPPPRH